MRTSTVTDEQIIYALRQVAQGTTATEICRNVGISEQTCAQRAPGWKKRFAGMGVAEWPRLRQLEAENRTRKQLVADLSLDKHMLPEVIRKKF